MEALSPLSSSRLQSQETKKSVFHRLLQLLAETNLTANQRDLVNTIRCSGETLLILITDILDFSRIEANKMVLSLHHFKLRTVLESAMEIAGLSAAQKRVQVSFSRSTFCLLQHLNILEPF